MPIKKIRWLFFTGMLLLCSVTVALAQENYDITYNFESKEIKINGIQSFSNKLFIKNNSSISAKLSFKQSVKSIISLPDTITLLPAEVKMLPVKYMVDRNTIQKALQTFTIQLTSLQSNILVQPEATFNTLLDDAEKLRISTLQTEYFLDPLTHQTEVKMVANNLGVVDLSYTLRIKEIPEGLEFLGDFFKKDIKAGEQFLLSFNIRNKHPNKQNDFLVDIEALDLEGKVLAAQKIKIVTVSSVKKYTDINGILFGQVPRDFIALRYQSMNYSNSNYLLQGNGKLNLGDHQYLDYHLNMEYGSVHERPIIYQTYANYENKHWGVKIGNIQENFDFNVSGRGIRARAKWNNHTSLSVFALERNYLITNLPDQKKVGKVLGISLEKNAHNSSLFTYFRSLDDVDQPNAHQLNGQTVLRVSHQQVLKLDGGISLESSSVKPLMGMSLGLDYVFDLRKVKFQTSQLWSSPYYTGLRRGLFQSYTSISVALSDIQQVSIRANVFKSNPKYQFSSYLQQYRNAMETNLVEIGYGISLKNLNIQIKPYYMMQKSEELISMPPHHFSRFESYRNSLHASYYNKKHRMSIVGDYGFTLASRKSTLQENFNSIKLQANYQYSILGLTMGMQLNPYYLSDIWVSNNGTDIRNYNIGPNLSLNAFKNKLNIQLASNYNYYHATKTRNISVNSSVKWHTKGNWALSGDVFISKLNQFNTFEPAFGRINFDNHYLRLGIEKKFNTSNVNRGKTLEMHFFEDRNNNGLLDKEEPALAGIVVKVAQSFAISDRNGSVKFQQIPEGLHKLEIISSKGWQLGSGEVLNLTKNTSRNYPMIKTSELNGCILFSEKSYDNSRPNLGGILITAEDPQGITYKTLSTSDGSYTFFLTPNTYIITANDKDLPFKISTPPATVKINENSRTTLDFKFLDNRRKVNIKKF